MTNVPRLTIALLFLLTPLSLPRPAVGATIHVPRDQETIQAAIDAASQGDTILVAAGTYQERIRMKKCVILRSVGDDAKGTLGLRRAEITVIDGGGSVGNGPGVAMADGSIIDGFTVTNVGEYDDAEWNHHHTTQGNQQSHQHIGQPGTPGIGVVGVTCVVRNNVVHHIGYTGIAIEGVRGQSCSPHVVQNVCYRNMGGGIGSMKGSAALIEANTCFENFYAGIGHDDASPTVINNTCYGNIRAGIGISHGACPIVRGNKCYQNRRAGIGTRTGTNTRPLIEGNDCYQNQMAGIGTEDEASPLIKGNRCYKNKLAGIGSRTRATPTIIANECFENEQVGVGHESDAATLLIDNHCHHNKAAGIGFDPCKNGRSRVINNRVTDNSLVAIGINSGWTVDLSGNELSRKDGMPPIVMVFDGAVATLSDNVIRGGGVAGVRVAGSVRMIQNKLICESMRRDGPPNFAVWGMPGSVVTMTNNHIQGWRHGLYASEASVTAAENTIRDFHETAMVVQNPRSPTNVFGNVAISLNPTDRSLRLNGDADIVANNRVLKDTPTGSTGEKTNVSQ